MKKFFILLTLLSMSANISLSFDLGSYDAGAVNSQYVRDLRSHEAIVRSKNNSAIISTKTAPKEQQELTASDIKSVTFVNNVSIPSSELELLVKDKINQPMSSENISAIRKDVMKYYQDRGFFSAVALISSQDYQTGGIVIEIQEGGKNSIIIE